MTWRGRDEALECRTVDEFVQYLHTLNFTAWKPSGMVLHNTASPTLEQYWNSVPPAERMENLKDYYENDMGWSAGPHAFVDGVSIWVFTDFNVKGVHSPSWNGTRLGIELVGDYDVESDETGMGLNVMELTVALFGECHSFFGWEPSVNSIRLHKEDPATDHDCPGKNVVKSEFLDDVTEYMGSGGDDQDAPIEARNGTVIGITEGDSLNIRAAASSSSAIIGHAQNGDAVVVVGEAARKRWSVARLTSLLVICAPLISRRGSLRAWCCITPRRRLLSNIGIRSHQRSGWKTSRIITKTIWVGPPARTPLLTA